MLRCLTLLPVLVLLLCQLINYCPHRPNAYTIRIRVQSTNTLAFNSTCAISQLHLFVWLVVCLCMANQQHYHLPAGMPVRVYTLRSRACAYLYSTQQQREVMLTNHAQGSSMVAWMALTPLLGVWDCWRAHWERANRIVLIGWPYWSVALASMWMNWCWEYDAYIWNVYKDGLVCIYPGCNISVTRIIINIYRNPSVLCNRVQSDTYCTPSGVLYARKRCNTQEASP